MNTTKTFLLLLLSMMMTAALRAGNIVNYTIEDGLSHNEVHSFSQDRNGFMWIGTNDGLNRFDGHKFINYSHQLNDVKVGNMVFVLYADKDSLWVGTNKGLAIVNLKTNAMSGFAADNTFSNSLISDITKDNKGNFWFATYTNGVFMYDGKSHKLTSIPYIYSKRINHLMLASDNRLWVATVDKGVVVIDIETGSISRIFNDLRGATSLFEDIRGNIWLATYDNTIIQYSPAKDEIISKTATHSIGIINKILNVCENRLYLATHYGLFKFDIDDKSATRAFTLPDAIPNNIFISNLYIDSENSLWMATLSKGVLFMAGNFDNIQTLKGANCDFTSKTIVSVDMDDEGTLWVGTCEEGLYRVNLEKSKCEKVNLHLQAHNNLNVQSIAHYRDKIICSVFGEGIVTLNRKDLSHPTLIQENLSSKEILKILVDKGGKVWLGTVWGLNVFIPDKMSVESVKNMQEIHITSIVDDGNGFLWVGTMNDGLIKYNTVTGKTEKYSYKNKSNSLPFASSIYCLYLQKNGKLYVGTNGSGVYAMNTSTGEFTPLKCDNWPNKVVNCIMEVDGELWVTTNNGIIKVGENGEADKVYSRSDGFCSNQFFKSCGLVTHDGTIITGGFSGLNCFNPANIKHNLTPPVLAFTNLYLSNEVVTPASSGSLLEQDINYTRHLDLPSGNNIFGIEFSAVTYVSPDKVKYRYKMEGYDDRWIDVKDVPRAVYTSLPAGDYVFRVKACNSDGIWNDKGKELSLTVLPPLLLSTPFLVSYIVLSFILLVIAIYLYVRRLNERHITELRNMTNNKNRELYEAKLEFFTNIIHEIRTPLTLIIVPLREILSNKEGDLSRHWDLLKTIERSSNRILSLVNQLMDYRKIDKGAFERQNEVIDIKPIIEGTFNQYHYTASCKHIDITLSMPSEPCYVNIDAECMTKIINNLLSNAIKFTKDKIEVIVGVSFGRKSISIEVADNGVGMSLEDIKMVTKPFYQAKNRVQQDNIGTGIGLSIVNDLVTLYDGKLDIRSIVNRGTTFAIAFTQQEAPAETVENGFADDKETKVDNEEENANAATSEKSTLLLVEDNPELRSYLHDKLLPEYEVLEAEDGVEAWKMLESKKVDLVLSDVMMPRMDGNELCTKIKTQIITSHIPVILLTAKVEINDKMQGYKNGADLYVEKPFTMELLLVQIRSILINKSKQRYKFSHNPLEAIDAIATNEMDNEFMNKVIDIVEKNISNSELSVDDLAKDVFMSRSRFFKKVKEVTGSTPNDFIKVLRLKAAAKMFSQGNTFVNDVCYKTGFATPSYFARCFQQQFGLLPSEYIGKLHAPKTAETQKETDNKK